MVESTFLEKKILRENFFLHCYSHAVKLLPTFDICQIFRYFLRFDLSVVNSQCHSRAYFRRDILLFSITNCSYCMNISPSRWSYPKRNSKKKGSHLVLAKPICIVLWMLARNVFSAFVLEHIWCWTEKIPLSTSVIERHSKSISYFCPCYQRTWTAWQTSPLQRETLERSLEIINMQAEISTRDAPRGTTYCTKFQFCGSFHSISESTSFQVGWYVLYLNINQ